MAEKARDTTRTSKPPRKNNRLNHSYRRSGATFAAGMITKYQANARACAGDKTRAAAVATWNSCTIRPGPCDITSTRRGSNPAAPAIQFRLCRMCPGWQKTRDILARPHIRGPEGACRPHRRCARERAILERAASRPQATWAIDGPEHAVADGALGFWQAVEEGRCAHNRNKMKIYLANQIVLC